VSVQYDYNGIADVYLLTIFTDVIHSLRFTPEMTIDPSISTVFSARQHICLSLLRWVRGENKLFSSFMRRYF